jgi:DNA-binding transcriptional MerR regulator
MRIGELAGELGLNPRTIRFYESIGVLPEPARTGSGYRDYGEPDIERLRFIKLTRSLGLSLDDIREILALRDRGESPCSYVRWVIEERAAAIEDRIRELERMRTELRKLRRVAQALPDEPQGDTCVCHILENDRLARAIGTA